MKCLKHVVPPVDLGVMRILDFQPTVLRVNPDAPLRDDPFQTLAEFLERMIVRLDELRTYGAC